MYTKVFFIKILICLSLSGDAQDTESAFQHFGGRIGVQFTIGQPVKRLGLIANAYYQHDWFQLNAEWQGYRNYASYGPKRKSWESRSSLGLIGAFGRKEETANPFIDILFHQTGRRYAAGYAFHYYKDDKKTSQGAGSIALHIDDFYVLTENDALGSTVGKDNFRTGGLAIGYRYQDWTYEIKTVLWTGQTRGQKTKTYRGEEAKDYPARWGYRDISKSLYGKYSHGVLAARVQYVMPYGHVAQIGFGVDDERIRNFVQNKLMHDMYFCPASWTTVRNLHFPMVDCEGEAYCFRKEQELKEMRLFYEAGVNGGRFY
ncbi:MAG: polymorphic toxin type 23 domain-containing protein [Saprospiraceae bacterium]